MNVLTIDPCFPQMAKVSDAEIMQRFFQQTLFNQPHLSIGSCFIDEKRYKPGKSLLLSYQVTMADLKLNVQQIHWLTVKVCPVNSHNNEFSSANGRYIDELNVWVWAFPDDRKLQHLPELLDSGFLQTYLAQNLSAVLGRTARIDAIQTKVMHYLPECSCMIRYSLTITDASEADTSREVIVYGKIYADDSGAKTYDTMQQLAKQLASTAQPLFYDADRQTLWQTHVAGQPLEWNAVNLTPPTLAAIAKAIAAFQACLLSSDKTYHFVDIQQGLTAACKIAQSTHPQFHQGVTTTVATLLRRHEQMDWGLARKAPMHLDLKLGNILIEGDQVAIIDLDCVALGDPLADTGSFIANLILHGLLAEAEQVVIEKVVRLFCAEYYAASSWAVDSSQLNWYVAAALIHEVIRRSLRQQNPQRQAHLNNLLELSNMFLAQCDAQTAAA